MPFVHIIPLSEAESFIGLLRGRLQEDGMWKPWLEQTIGDTHRFAVGISPVWTGSYRESHRLAINTDERFATLTIDPGARNTVTGTPVVEYAGPVEGRHHVYRQAFEKMKRLAVTNADMILKRWESGPYK